MLALIALLSLAVQSLVVQTHVHLERTAASSADRHPGASSVRRADRTAPSPEPIDCPTCRLLAHAGDLLLPTPVCLALLAPATPWVVDAPAVSWAWRTRSHAWRSRGPPSVGPAIFP